MKTLNLQVSFQEGSRQSVPILLVIFLSLLQYPSWQCVNRVDCHTLRIYMRCFLGKLAGIGIMSSAHAAPPLSSYCNYVVATKKKVI